MKLRLTTTCHFNLAMALAIALVNLLLAENLHDELGLDPPS